MPKYTGTLRLDLSGPQGNAFAVLGLVSGHMRERGASASDIAKFNERATSGDYDHLLIESGKMVRIRDASGIYAAAVERHEAAMAEVDAEIAKATEEAGEDAMILRLDGEIEGFAMVFSPGDMGAVHEALDMILGEDENEDENEDANANAWGLAEPGKFVYVDDGKGGLIAFPVADNDAFVDAGPTKSDDAWEDDSVTDEDRARFSAEVAKLKPWQLEDEGDGE
jgi:hypothetical protein